MTGQRLQRQELAVRTVDCVQGVDQVVADDVPDAPEDRVLAAVAVHDVRGAEPYELRLAAAHDDDPAEPRQLAQLHGELAAAGAPADD